MMQHLENAKIERMRLLINVKNVMLIIVKIKLKKEHQKLQNNVKHA